jgi:arsenate reductase
MGGPRTVARAGDAAAKPGGAKPPARPMTPPMKKRVLFVCIGNSCRSQMAEGFARAYGSDIIDARSAGLAPATSIAPLTRQVLGEKNVRIDDHFPKGVEVVSREPFDIVVNMSGTKLSIPGTRVIEWPVQDPMGHAEAVFRSVAAQVEGLVMRLILELRSGPR